MKTDHAQEKLLSNDRTDSPATTEISTIGITVVGITAGVIGFWAVTSMIAGVVNSGGPVELIVNFLKAVTGQ